jgi:valyl-tRNA synthetase
LSKQKEKLDKEVAKLNGMLSNKKFVDNAPKDVVETNQKALDDAKEKLSKVESELKSLKG